MMKLFGEVPGLKICKYKKYSHLLKSQKTHTKYDFSRSHGFKLFYLGFLIKKKTIAILPIFKYLGRELRKYFIK